MGSPEEPLQIFGGHPPPKTGSIDSIERLYTVSLTATIQGLPMLIAKAPGGINFSSSFVKPSLDTDPEGNKPNP